MIENKGGRSRGGSLTMIWTQMLIVSPLLKKTSTPNYLENAKLPIQRRLKKRGRGGRRESITTREWLLRARICWVISRLRTLTLITKRHLRKTKIFAKKGKPSELQDRNCQMGVSRGCPLSKAQLHSTVRSWGIMLATQASPQKMSWCLRARWQTKASKKDKKCRLITALTVKTITDSYILSATVRRRRSTRRRESTRKATKERRTRLRR